ncbi:hypothetical protein TIFTF001_007554 [Ficus carica]|uniref:Uncharacterized protein n=1 Tax=Ficus carica TaxID=3494 RepID=A0AA88ADL1_FICCA|nr:hypothetical protein TIFTF001_007554 [Ficus carica]
MLASLRVSISVLTSSVRSLTFPARISEPDRRRHGNPDYSAPPWPVVGLSGSVRVTPQSVTCKKEAPRNDGDTSVVSAAGTSMLKSARIPICKRRGRALARQKMTIPEFMGSSSIYMRFPGYWSNRWVPRGPRLYIVSSRTPWASPTKGQQFLSEWLAAGGDLTCDGSWWAASATGEVWIQPMSDHGRPPGAWPGDLSWCNVSRSLPSTPSSGHPSTRLRQLSSPRPNECSRHDGDPSREGCPVVGDDRVINNTLLKSLKTLQTKKKG